MKMIQKMRGMANEPFVFDEDEEAKALISELGMMPRLAKAVPGNEEKSALQAILNRDDESHYLLAMRFTGHHDPSENGFAVMGLPKSKLDDSTAFKMFSNYLEESGFSAKAILPFDPIEQASAN